MKTTKQIIKESGVLPEGTFLIHVEDVTVLMDTYANQSKWMPIAEADLIDQNAYWCYPSPKEKVEPMSYIDGVFYSQTNEYEKSIITHVQPYAIPAPPQI